MAAHVECGTNPSGHRQTGDACHLVVGDTLIDRGNGLEFPADWANKGIPAKQIRKALRPLLELPVELVLQTHGGPADRAALERALS